jgi:DNA-binding NtrC family response regulator
VTRSARPALLVVEDEKLVRWSVRAALKDQARVRMASTAEKALRTLQGSARLDGLLVDIRLPGSMDGLELAREARRLRPGIKVFVMTAFDQDRAARDAFGVHAVAYLPKPFSIDVLRDMLASHL